MPTISDDTINVMQWLDANSPAILNNSFSALITKFTDPLPNTNLSVTDMTALFYSYQEHKNQRGFFSFSFDPTSHKHVSEYLDWLAVTGKTNILLTLWKAGAAQSNCLGRIPHLASLNFATFDEYKQAEQCMSLILKRYRGSRFPYEQPVLQENPDKFLYHSMVTAIDHLPDNIKSNVIIMLLHKAVTSDNFVILRHLMQFDFIEPKHYENLFKNAVTHGKSHAVETLLANKRINKNFLASLLNDAINNGQIAIARLMLPHITILGLPLEELLTPSALNELSDKIQSYDLVLLSKDPLTFLEQYFADKLKHPSMLLANRIVKANEYVKRAEATYTQSSETAMSPRQLSAAAIAYEKALNLYGSKLEEIAKESLGDKFPAFTQVEQTRHAIEKIEYSIRGLLLDKILEETDDNTVRDFINTHRELLTQGKDEPIMNQARQYFQSNTNNLHVAWRAYDPQAPTTTWINLLTPPINNDRHQFGAQDKTPEEISWDVRQRVVIYYLALQDSNAATASQEDRLAFFISEIAEIRRAHNFNDTLHTDNPSCYPGTIGRIAKMGRGHRDLIVVDPVEELSKVIQSLLSQRVDEVIKGCDEKQREIIYWSLVALTKDNVDVALRGQNVLSKQQIPEEQWVKVHQDILGGLGTIQEVFDKINVIFANSDPKIRPLAYDEFAYVARQLIDINHNGVGLTIAEQYKPKPPLQNPYLTKEPKTIKPLSMQEALRIMNFHLQDVPNKSGIMMGAAQLVSQGKHGQAMTQLEQSKIIPPDKILIIDAALLEAQKKVGTVSQAWKQKAKLWDELNEAFNDSEIESKGDALKEIVDKVIDKNKNVGEVLAKYHLSLPKEKDTARPKAVIHASLGSAEPLSESLLNPQKLPTEKRKKTPK